MAVTRGVFVNPSLRAALLTAYNRAACGLTGHQMVDGICTACGVTTLDLATDELDLWLRPTLEDEPDETGIYRRIRDDD